jgi:hypothetical protein
MGAPGPVCHSTGHRKRKKKKRRRRKTIKGIWLKRIGNLRLGEAGRMRSSGEGEMAMKDSSNRRRRGKPIWGNTRMTDLRMKLQWDIPENFVVDEEDELDGKTVAMKDAEIEG